MNEHERIDAAISEELRRDYGLPDPQPFVTPLWVIRDYVTVSQQLLDDYNKAPLASSRPGYWTLRRRLRARFRGYVYRTRNAVALRIAPWLREDDWEDW